MTPTRPIPAQIHMIWFNEQALPDAYAHNRDAWAKAYPHCDVSMWSENEYLRSVDQHNATAYVQAAQLKPNDYHRMRADIARLDILYELGGLYVDCDSEPTGDMTELLGRHSFVAGRSPQHINGEHPITNAVIGSGAGHPFVQAAIDELPKSVRRHKNRTTAQITGPWHLTRTYKTYTDLHNQVHIVESGQLYDGTYLIHHWDNAKQKKKQ